METFQTKQILVKDVNLDFDTRVYLLDIIEAPNHVNPFHLRFEYLKRLLINLPIMNFIIDLSI